MKGKKEKDEKGQDECEREKRREKKSKRDRGREKIRREGREERDRGEIVNLDWVEKRLKMATTRDRKYIYWVIIRFWPNGHRNPLFNLFLLFFRNFNIYEFLRILEKNLILL